MAEEWDDDEIIIEDQPCSLASLNNGLDENDIRFSPSQIISLNCFMAVSSSSSSSSTATAPSAPSESIISENMRLSEKVARLNKELLVAQQTIADKDEYIVVRDKRMAEGESLVIAQKVAADHDFAVYTKLVEKERKQRLEAEEKLTRCTNSLKSVHEENTLFMKRVEGSWMGGDELLSKLKAVQECVEKKQKEEMALKEEAKEMESRFEDFWRMIGSKNGESDEVALPAENTEKVKILSIQSVKEETIPLVYLDDDDDESFPVSAIPKSKGSHGFAMEDQKQDPFYCICGSQYKSRRSLRYHINYMRGDPKFECDICKECFLYRCYLVRHLERKHKIQRDDDERSTKRANGGKRSSKRGEKIKPRSQGTGSRIGGPKITKISSEHFQVSSDKTDKYICECGNKYGRKPGLLKHIDYFNELLAEDYDKK